MKKVLALLPGSLLTTLLYAQPGAPFQSYNLNQVQDPVNHYTQQYYIDSTTLESSYARLDEYPQLDELHLRLDHIPAGLVAHGRHIRQISISNPHHIQSYNSHWSEPKKSIYDLELLNYLPALEQVYVMGYRIDHRPDSVFKTLEKCSIPLVKTDSAKALFAMGDVNIVHFPSSLCIRSLALGKMTVTDSLGIQRNPYIRSVSMAGLHELPNWLPPAIESISVSDGDSLTSIQHLETYKNLQSISVRGCFRLQKFPKNIPVKKLQRLVIQLHPQHASELMAALTTIDTIGEMELEFYQGFADLDFKNLSLQVGRLNIYGTSSGKRTTIQLNNLQNLGAGSFHLAGNFSTIPDVTLMHRLDEFHFTSYVPIADKASVQQLSRIKNLNRFTLRNYRLSVFPEIFFAHNPHLTYIGFIGTDIEKLSFGKTVLTDLKQLYMRENPKLKKIPPKSFYPNAWKPDIEKKYDY